MKSGMIRWKMEFWYPNPLSLVHRALKFSAVFGTMWAKSSIVILPIISPSAAIVKNTVGLLGLESSMTFEDWAAST